MPGVCRSFIISPGPRVVKQGFQTTTLTEDRTPQSDAHAFLQQAFVLGRPADDRRWETGRNLSSPGCSQPQAPLPLSLTKGNLVDGGGGGMDTEAWASEQHPGSRESPMRQTEDAASVRRGKSGLFCRVVWAKRQAWSERWLVYL